MGSERKNSWRKALNNKQRIDDTATHDSILAKKGGKKRKPGLEIPTAFLKMWSGQVFLPTTPSPPPPVGGDTPPCEGGDLLFHYYVDCNVDIWLCYDIISNYLYI